MPTGVSRVRKLWRKRTFSGISKLWYSAVSEQAVYRDSECDLSRTLCDDMVGSVEVQSPTTHTHRCDHGLAEVKIRRSVQPLR